MPTGELVRLRAFEPSEAEALWRWNHDAEVMRWMDDGYPDSLAQVTKRMSEWKANSYEKVVLAVETLADAQLIGVVVLRDVQPETGHAELDIYIGEKDHWGSGYATDAMRTACRFGFEKMRLHRITLWVVADNVAARRVYEKAGFVEEGRQRESFRRDGRWHDMVMMGLLEGELRG
ncbi:GNAT family N-acetyltransferase [Allokutzneria sp. A3M-2-11 16]|uniref:GNAT family N-acetyltransferase n=1 Tax=Allokutzneria sp. A3M-2-11 16 TaxID=2962043 RepID=UPI0020B8118D|nr:GNAT family protein [Allokutzneria sp. A3M-2-11 16]MCP3801597.1 GNAT family N-acetyltransferase [Allokutzneria sp. A3M-2-11 16]